MLMRKRPRSSRKWGASQPRWRSTSSLVTSGNTQVGRVGPYHSTTLLTRTRPTSSGFMASLRGTILGRGWPVRQARWLADAVVLDDAEDALTSRAPEGVGQVPADIVLFDLEHLHEARRGAGRGPFHEHPPPVEDVIPRLAEEGPEGVPWLGEGLGGRALGIGQPHVPVLSRLAGERDTSRVAVNGLDVVLPLQPAVAVGDHARVAVEGVVVRAAHVPALPAGNGRVVPA